jgi:serine/threonine protein kinase
MSPELLRNQHYDRWVDVWALGIVTAILLTGRIPYDSNTNSELKKEIVLCGPKIDWR